MKKIGVLLAALFCFSADSILQISKGEYFAKNRRF